MEYRNLFINNFLRTCDNCKDSPFVYYVSKEGKTLGINYKEIKKITIDLSVYFSKIFDLKTRYIGVALSNYLYLPAIVLAIWKSGFSFAGSGSQYPFRDTLQYFDSLKVKYIITDEKGNPLHGNKLSCFYINENMFIIWERKICITEGIIGPWDFCFGIMTSGTTGTPKVIQVPWSCILHNSKNLKEIFEITSSDCIYQASPCTFDPFFVELFLTILSGASLLIVNNVYKLLSTTLLSLLFKSVSDNCENILMNKSSTYAHIETNTQKFTVNIENHGRKQVSVLQTTPSIFKQWSDTEINSYILSKKTSLRILILGGEKFDRRILQLKDSENQTKIFNIYGITEVSCWTFLNEVTTLSPSHEISLGNPLSNVCFKISEKGELIIGSKTQVCVMSNEQVEKLIDEVVFRSTGDKVEFVEGKLFYRGRFDQMVKKYGIKVNLEKIKEKFVEFNKSFKDCFCVFDEATMKLGLFYLLKNSDHNYESKFISHKEFISNGYIIPKVVLKDCEIPDYIFEIATVPMNNHGKLNCSKLLELLKQKQSNETSLSYLKKIFIDFWKEVSGNKQPDYLSKSFTEIGGTSILALQLVSKLKELQIEPPLTFIKILLSEATLENCLECLNDSKTIFEVPKKKMKIMNGDDESTFKLLMKWQYNLEKCVDATPTVITYQGKKLIIVGSHSCKLCAVNASTGLDEWTVSLGGRIESGFTATCNGSKGVVGCYDTFVYCVSVVDGSLLWKFKTGDMIKSTPCFSTDENLVFVASYDAHLYCLFTESGTLQKKLKLNEKGIFSSGLVSSYLSTYFIATLDGSCVAFCQNQLKVKWKRKLQAPVFASPCLVRNTEIVFADVQGGVHCFDARDGSLIWNYSVNGFIFSSALSHFLDDWTYIIFGCNDESLYCLRYNKKVELKWKLQLDSSIFARPAILSYNSKWMVCAASTKGFIYLCDFYFGTILAKLKLGGEVFSSPVVHENEVFVGCRDNNVLAIKIWNT